MRFEADGVLERVTVCNCSLCAKTGYLHWYVKPEHFRLVQDPHLFNINVRCLDDVDIAALTIDAFDGQHWEASVDAGALDALRNSADEG